MVTGACATREPSSRRTIGVFNSICSCAAAQWWQREDGSVVINLHPYSCKTGHWNSFFRKYVSPRRQDTADVSRCLKQTLLYKFAIGWLRLKWLYSSVLRCVACLENCKRNLEDLDENIFLNNLELLYLEIFIFPFICLLTYWFWTHNSASI